MAALLLISVAALGTAVLVKLILDDLDDLTDDVAVDQVCEGSGLVEFA